MATGYSDAVIDQMWTNLRGIVRQLQLQQSVDFYQAWETIRVLDQVERIWKRGDYMYCRHVVAKKAKENHIVRQW